MKRIKVLKAYLIIWLFILYVVYANAELLGIFFMATVIFSTAIVGLLAVGTLYQIVSGFDIMMLGGTFGALAYKKTGYEFYIRSINSLLPANIAHMLQSRKSKQTMFFTQEESRNIIEWLDNKFRKQKSYINFFINTSMLIGLLGTFVGLVEAIDNMGQIILGLNGEIDIKQIMQDFSGPLTGMAIGFGASLFGVVAAVILGINGYVLFRSQDTLISGIEDWLKDRIIDVVPEAIGNMSTSALNLPEHRKSFMEVFLEQMSSFTGEIAKFSKSNENLPVMSATLTSMKHMMETQQETFNAMVSLHRNQQNEFNRFSQELFEKQVSYQQQQFDNHSTLTSLLTNQTKTTEHNGELLVQVDTTLGTLNEKMQAQQENLLALIALEEKVADEHKLFFNVHETLTSKNIETLQEINASVINVNQAITEHQRALEIFMKQEEENSLKASNRHEVLVAHVDGIQASIEKQTGAIESIAQRGDEHFASMVRLFENTLDKLLLLDQGITKNGITLFEISTAQKEQFSQTLQQYALVHQEISNLHDTLNVQIKAVEYLTTTQHNMHDEIKEKHEHSFDVLNAIAVTLQQTEKTMVALVALEEEFKREYNDVSLDAKTSAQELHISFEESKNLLQSMLETQEQLHQTYAHSHVEAQEALQSINGSILGESEVVKEVLQTSQQLYAHQQESMEAGIQALGTIHSELQKAEALNLEYAEQRKEFETKYFQHTEDEHLKMIQVLNEKMELTQAQIETMTQSLKNIESFVSKFDKTKFDHNSTLGEDIKGFFTNLFHKN